MPNNGTLEITPYELQIVMNGFRPELIENVEFYPPAVKMTFSDGRVITSTPQKGDAYDPEMGMIMCILKYIWSGSGYNTMFRKWIRKDEKKHQEAIAAKKAAKEEKERRERRYLKKKERDARKAEERKRAMIDINKEAVLEIMKALQKEFGYSERA